MEKEEKGLRNREESSSGIKLPHFIMLLALFVLLVPLRLFASINYEETNPSTQGDVTVSGQVVDKNGLTIPGVNVFNKADQMNGVITDLDGKYSITVPSDATLVFSFIGFNKQEIPVNGKTEINVTMLEESQEINEVVVTALGIKKESKVLGYAVSKIDNSRIMASGTPANPLQSLYGSAAGVQIQSTAAGPTGGMNINIRNAVSFDAASSTRPLIVVDGVPIHDENTGMGKDATSRDNGTGINDINPDDIASFEILKGAKASVLYGSEGANGVILITTKSGGKNKGLGISASVTHTFDNIAFMPNLQDVYGTGRSPSNPETDEQGYYIDHSGKRALDYSGSAFGPKFDPSVTLNWWDGTQHPWVAKERSIYDKLYRTGHQTTTNVSFSNGNDKGSVRFSYTNTKIKPITPASEYDKNAFSFSANYDLNKFITIKYSANYYVTKNLNAPNEGTFNAQGAATSLGAYSADIDVDLLRQYMVTEDGFNFFADPAKTNFISNGRNSVVNFFWDQEQNEDIFNRDHNIQSLTFDFTLSKAFSFVVMGGLDATTERSQFKGKLLDPALHGQKGSGLMYSDVNRIMRNTYGQAMLNFNKDVKDFNFSGFVGGVIRHNYLEKKGARAEGILVIPNWFSFNNLPSDQEPIYQFDNGEDILYSVMGSFQIGWKRQVYVELQARNDWSSILPPGNNSYFYPGVSGTWIMNESFNMPNWVQFMKMRFSFADVGRPGPRYFSNMNYGVTASGGAYVLTPPADLPPVDENIIPNLQPERKREYEIGFETYLFNSSRIGLDFSYYKSNTYDQIMKVKAPPGMGVENIRMNAGNVANRGWELALKTKPILNKNFGWNLNFMFSSGKTKVIKLDGKLTSLKLWDAFGALNAVADVGGEYGIIYQQKGLSKYINPSDPNDPNNGKYFVQDDGRSYSYVTTSPKKVGKVLPDVTGGIFSSFNYKNIRLVFNIDYSFGATFISGGETYMMASGILEETFKYRDKENGGIAYHVDDSGQKVVGEKPGYFTYWDGVLLDGVRTDGTQNPQVVSAEDYYYTSYFANGFFPEDRIFKSDYVALRNLAVDYTLPKKLIEKVKLQDMSLSVFANNLAYIYKDAPNSIPESGNGTGMGSSSQGTSAAPGVRTFGFSVKLKF